MTDFVPFPHVPVVLPESGKVTGQFVLVVRGDTALVLTDGAHINDDNPRINYRGDGYLAHLELVRDAEGNVTFGVEFGHRSPTQAFTRGWGNLAPPSYAKAIAEAVRAASQEVWTDEVVALGEFSSAAQALSYVERDLADAEEKAAEVRKVHGEAYARYQTAVLNHPLANA